MVVAIQGQLHEDQPGLLLLLAQVDLEAVSAAALGVHLAAASEVGSVVETEEVLVAETEAASVEEEEGLAIKAAVALVEEVVMVALQTATVVLHLLPTLLLALGDVAASVVDLVGRQLTVA